MLNKKKQRTLKLGLTILIFSAGVYFILMALQQQVQLYVTPTEFWQNFETTQHQQIKIGGVVKVGSIKFDHAEVGVSFIVTDFKNELKVHYTNLLPALFKSGKGVVLSGKWQKNHLEANQVLAKHDENYQPPKINRQS